jgi:hypothetical protein
MFISPVDPLQSYPAFFLYAITDPILPATSGVPIYRRAELDGCGYNTKNLTQGILYLLWCPKGKSAAAGDDITYDPPTSTSVDVSLVVAVDGGE